MKSALLTSHLQKAAAFQQNGNGSQAKMLYEKILAAAPRNFDALYSLAMIAAQQRQFHDAEKLLRRATAANPAQAVAHHNLGLVLRELGRLEDAIACLDRAIALAPQFALAYFNKGIVLERLNCLEAALDSYEQAVARQSDWPEAHSKRGKVLYELNRLDAALASYDLAIAQRPAFASAYCNRAIVLGALGRHEAAIVSCDRAIAINPRDAGSFFNRGVALKELCRLDEALSSYDQAIAINPRLAEAYCNRGVVLKDLNQWDAALASYDQAIALNDGLAEAYHNKGNALAALGQVDAAINNFDKAIALKSDDASAHFSRATTLLLAGDFERGWSGYEWRWRKTGVVDRFERSDLQTPRWLGGCSLEGRTILLYGEQGFGDTLQFCRYATLVAESGARVILEAPPALRTLLTSVAGVAKVTLPGEVLSGFDYHCPLMSLPLAFKTTLASVPAPQRYLHTPADRAQFWREKLRASQAKLKVGLVWSGGFRANQPEAWPVTARRNIPLAQLAPLRHSDIEFFSLQLGDPAAGDLARLAAEKWAGPEITDYTNLLADFSDTAGLIDSLDLVIAVDTSTAHLAGALGKPVWILNRFDTCWRWLLGREDSPWYPSVRLYRQQSPGDWSTVVQRVRSDLFELLT
jgi:tetratricopeptide (TPR) repeat protein